MRETGIAEEALVGIVGVRERFRSVDGRDSIGMWFAFGPNLIGLGSALELLSAIRDRTRDRSRVGDGAHVKTNRIKATPDALEKLRDTARIDSVGAGDSGGASEGAKSGEMRGHGAMPTAKIGSSARETRESKS